MKKTKKAGVQAFSFLLAVSILSGAVLPGVVPFRERVYGMTPAEYYTLWDLFSMMMETAGYTVSYGGGDDTSYNRAEFDRMMHGLDVAFNNYDDPEVRKAWLEITDEIARIGPGPYVSAEDLAEVTSWIDFDGLHLTQSPDYAELPLRMSYTADVYSNRGALGTRKLENGILNYVSMSAVPYDSVCCVYTQDGVYHAHIYNVSRDPFSAAMQVLLNGEPWYTQKPMDAKLFSGYYYFDSLSWFSSYPVEIENASASVFNGTIYDYIDTLPDIVNGPDVSITRDDMGCPAEVPDIKPWRKERTIPDEWRVLDPAKETEKDPDGDKDDDKDKKKKKR